MKLQNNEAKMKAPHSLFCFACTHLIRRAAEGWEGWEGWGVGGWVGGSQKTGNDELTGEMTGVVFG